MTKHIPGIHFQEETVPNSSPCKGSGFGAWKENDPDAPAAKNERIVKVIPREDDGIHVFAHRGVGVAVHKYRDEVR